MIKTVLFDLDGTLADTAPDLAHALNRTLEAFGRPPLPYERIRPVVSHGGVALLRLGFDLGPGEPGYDERRAHLLEVYRANLTRETRPFPGIPELLDWLEASERSWGVVTNKPAWLTEPLLEQLGLLARAAVVVSGDTVEPNKPHPAPLLHACHQTGSMAGQCIYVGDAERDIQAGRAAGMHTLVALFGYLAAADDPAAWQADGLINAPGDIMEFILSAEASKPSVR
ncbi:2-phosphoglycolate phosphatase [Thiohalobacter thiocyanaticus]|uniref:2-phosphoglycolate phosphatase n=1 Tax=Thiohalobacter thiocyanaticus TaxID=585455 RepID=A0A1Z4VSF8_9GAMM|nr:HAD-IA family hydrolase [Thiohalobacter thiocyanaticus]BAZ94571.1 2-phosphoglycolate phosphatase [Thiohalobacter thiocyanaticus]